MNISLHPKYGVNASMTQCFYCGKGKDIILPGSQTGNLKKAGVDVAKDGKMPMYAGALDLEPCDKCKEFMEQGIILISVKNGQSGDTPYRTGGFVVVSEEGARRIFTDDVIKDVISKRICFIDDTAWDSLGLPR